MDDILLVEGELDQDEKDLLLNMKRELENEVGSEQERANLASLLAFSKFFPWGNAHNRVIKKYWREIGGIQVLVEALRKAAIGSHTPLKLNIASAIWCYGESEQFSLEVVKAGAVTVAIELLKSDVFEVVQKAIGMLMGFIVHEELLDMMAEEGVIDVFVNSVLKIDHYSLHNGDSSRLMATIQSTTNNYNCRGRLLKIAPLLVNLLCRSTSYKFNDHIQRATLNHCAAVLASLAVDDRIYEHVTAEQVAKALRKASKSLCVDDIADAEKQLSYVWTYLNRFVPLFHSTNVLIRRYAAFSMAYLSISEQNRAKIIKQGLLGYIQMMSFSHDAKTKKFALSALRRFNEPFVASLRTIAHWTLLQHVGTERCKLLVAECNIAV